MLTPDDLTRVQVRRGPIPGPGLFGDNGPPALGTR